MIFIHRYVAYYDLHLGQILQIGATIMVTTAF
jgi:hypothetical protein